MIDTDKYEGHQVSDFKTSVAGPKHSWVTHQHKLGYKDAMFVNHATAALVTDAPLLLAEIERLRDKLLRSLQWVEDRYGYATTGDFATVRDYIKFIGSEEE
jgi:hypothetical protein